MTKFIFLYFLILLNIISISKSDNFDDGLSMAGDALVDTLGQGASMASDAFGTAEEFFKTQKKNVEVLVESIPFEDIKNQIVDFFKIIQYSDCKTNNVCKCCIQAFSETGKICIFLKKNFTKNIESKFF